MNDAKFRAWDRFREKHIFTGFHVVGEVTCFSLMDQTILEDWDGRKKKYGYTGTIEAWNDFEFEQYSTMSDNQDVEIYAGDIIRIHFGIPPTHVDEAVEFKNGAFYLVSPTRKEDILLSHPDQGDIEIVGHIHQNQKLLK